MNCTPRDPQGADGTDRFKERELHDRRRELEHHILVQGIPACAVERKIKRNFRYKAKEKQPQGICPAAVCV